MKLPKLAEVRKAVVAAVGLVAQIVAAGVLTGTVLHVAQAVLAVAALAGVYAAPNDHHPSTPPVTGSVITPPVGG